MSEFVYTGQENLEAMKVARNYNNYLMRMVLDQLKGRTGKVRILDFGAGIGTYADMLKKRGVEVDCLEIDQSQVKILTKKGYTVFSDISKLDKYDIIYSFNVFEHIANDIEVHSLLSAKLAKGGRIITYVPAFQSLYSSMDKLVGHERRYRKDRLQEMAEKANLKIAVLRYCDPIGYVASMVYKAIGNKQGTITKQSVKTYDTFAFPISSVFEFITRPFFGKNAVLIAEKK